MKYSTNTIRMWLTLTAALAGCQQNPLPTDGQITSDPVRSRPVLPAFSLEADEVLECEEGKVCQMDVKGHVPEGGEASVKLSGLPAGATYDPLKRILTFAPGFDAVDTTLDPNKKLEISMVEAEVTTSASAIAVYRKKFALVAKNVNRAIILSANALNIEAHEGQAIEQKLKIESEDFPKGPFKINIVGIPLGAEIEQDPNDPTLFTVKYTPSFDLVTNSSDYDFSNDKHFARKKVQYVVSAPSGFISESIGKWTIWDVKQDFVVSAPESITQGSVVDFNIRIDDPNGEFKPDVTLKDDVPFGRFELQALGAVEKDSESDKQTYSLYSVRWDRIKREHFGKSVPLVFKTCFERTNWSWNSEQCKEFTVTVNLSGSDRSRPLVDRTEWDASKVRYLREGEKTEIKLPIFDADDDTAPVEVVVQPESMRDSVSWAEGLLTINPKNSGVQQFNLAVTSEYDQTTVEGFLYETLPASWSENVIVAHQRVTDEAVDIQRRLGSADILYGLGSVSERSMALRRNLYVTTEALSSPDGVMLVEDAAKRAQNVIVLSPLMTNSKAFTEELSSLGIDSDGRISDKLDALTLQVDPKSDLSIPKVPAGLGGKLTSESESPLKLKAQPNSACERLYSLQKPATDWTVGYRCSRSGGGKFIALGFEVSDAVVAADDAEVPSDWLKNFSK